MPVAVFAVLTLIVTWPLPLRLTSAVPGDYGDPLFISWAMSWVADRLIGALTSPSSLHTFWDAPIFAPEPTALAFSEHFIPQTLLTLPVYWLTGNAILCYNIAFLAAFTLTGATTAMLARALTGSLSAGLLAGVVASFNELRLVWEVARLQVLWVHWLPLVLLGIHRYAATGQRGALAGAGATWVALNLSSVYYLAYCAPMIGAFSVIEVLRYGRERQPRAWRDLLLTAATVGVLTAPFIWPYLLVQQRHGFARTQQEVVTHSATIDAYRNALPGLAVPLTLSLVAVLVAGARRLKRHAPADEPVGAIPASLVAGLLLLVLASAWLSLGPVVQAGGEPAGVPSLYAAVAWLPGYSGLRVPSRFASILLIFLGVLAACGAVAAGRGSRRLTAFVATLAAAVMLWQGRTQAMPIDQVLPSPTLAVPPAYLAPAARLPAVYRAIAHLPADTIVAEFPFGDPWYDVRYMFFAAQHRRALMNGYSGIIPPSYVARRATLAHPERDPERAWQSIGQATYAVVHGAAWENDTGDRIEAWLASKGAELVGRYDGASVYRLPKMPGRHRP